MFFVAGCVDSLILSLSAILCSRHGGVSRWRAVGFGRVSVRRRVRLHFFAPPRPVNSSPPPPHPPPRGPAQKNSAAAPKTDKKKLPRRRFERRTLRSLLLCWGLIARTTSPEYEAHALPTELTGLDDIVSKCIFLAFLKQGWGGCFYRFCERALCFLTLFFRFSDTGRSPARPRRHTHAFARARRHTPPVLSEVRGCE